MTPDHDPLAGQSSFGVGDPPAQPDPDEDSPQTIHRPGTFPVTGQNVVFSIEEGEEITGQLRATLSWDPTSPEDIVIHLAAFLVNKDNQVPGGNPYYCVNHDNNRSKDGSTERKGRREHGHAVRNETITVELDLVDEEVERVVFVAHIQDAKDLKHTFGVLKGGMVNLVQFPKRHNAEDDDAEAKEVIQHTLDGDYYDEETVVVIGEVFRQQTAIQPTWAFREIAHGHKDLIEVGAYYGVTFVHSR